MDKNVKSLPADEVIEKFGGLRPLASRLGIAASTVQGWKERGVIPESRTEEIMIAAAEDGIILDLDTQSGASEIPAEVQSPTSQPSAPDQQNKIQSKFTQPQNFPTELEEDRREYNDRRSGDRRQRQDPNYKGADRRVRDRRTGVDRRQQRAAEWVHKKRFLERWVLMMSIFFFLIVLVTVFLLAPEYKKLQERAVEYDRMKLEMAQINRELENISQERGSISGYINEGISRLEQTRDEVAKQIRSAEEIASEFASGNWRDRFNLTEQKIFGFSTMMDRVDGLMNTPGGAEALNHSLNRVSNMLASQQDVDPEMLQGMRQDDPILSTVMKDVRGDDVKAALMLLTMNQLRSSLGKDRASFDQDLQLLRELNEDDPEILAAIERLTPYAQSGVLTPSRLNREFRGLAGDIVMAKLRGEDATARDRAMDRLSDMMTIRRIDNLEGNDPDAIVARAQLLIEQNDIAGAISELQRLEGEPAAVATPWIQQAQNYVNANAASEDIAQKVMHEAMAGQNLSPQAIQNLMRTLLGQGPSVSSAVVSGGNTRRNNPGAIGPGNFGPTTTYEGLTAQ